MNTTPMVRLWKCFNARCLWRGMVLTRTTTAPECPECERGMFL